MGFWSGLLVGWIWGTASIAIVLYLARRAREATFNHIDHD